MLIAAIGVAIALGAHNRSGYTEQNKAYAAAIIQEATNIRMATDRMVINGVMKTAAFATLDTNAYTGLYNPTLGGIPMQIPPPEAVTGPGNWLLLAAKSGSYPNINAHGGASFNLPDNTHLTDATVVRLRNVTKEVCQAIDQALFGSPNIPLGFSDGGVFWDEGFNTFYKMPGVEACILPFDETYYVYYKVLEDSSPQTVGPQ